MGAATESPGSRVSQARDSVSIEASATTDVGHGFVAAARFEAKTCPL